MLESDLELLVRKIQQYKTELNYVEVKAAHEGAPHKLYDTLSSFSNLAGGGIIVFGLDEEKDFKVVGVYDANELQNKVAEQCTQMSPAVRAVFTTAIVDGETVLAAEIPEIDIADKPCFYTGRGRLTGSYVRVGDRDDPMTEYEIYSYEAFRKKYQDDVRPIAGASLGIIDSNALEGFLERLRGAKPRLAALGSAELCELLRLTAAGSPTLVNVLLFGRYPQGIFPQLALTAVALAGESVAELGESGERFIDNSRIDGTLPEILEGALAFVKKNMRKRTVIDETTGERRDSYEYPIVAVREIILNALVHRDYSIHTEGMPIQLKMYRDRLEVLSPGGIYGRLRVSDLGRVQPDTRNPALAVILEDMGLTENRYSGIPTIYRAMSEARLPAPVFAERRGVFCVTLYNAPVATQAQAGHPSSLLDFCSTARSREEIAAYLGVKTINYVMKKYITPLIEAGKLKRTIPETPRSKLQKYITVRE